MSENHRKITWRDRQVHLENRKRFTCEELAKYAGQWVAWSADGTKIVAHHEDFGEVLRMVDEAGIDREEVVFDARPPAGVDTLL